MFVCVCVCVTSLSCPKEPLKAVWWNRSLAGSHLAQAIKSGQWQGWDNPGDRLARTHTHTHTHACMHGKHLKKMVTYMESHYLHSNPLKSRLKIHLISFDSVLVFAFFVSVSNVTLFEIRSFLAVQKQLHIESGFIKTDMQVRIKFSLIYSPFPQVHNTIQAAYEVKLTLPCLSQAASEAKSASTKLKLHNCVQVFPLCTSFRPAIQETSCL